MKKALFSTLCAAMIAAPLFAQGDAGYCEGGETGAVTTTDVRGHAAQITLSGGIDIDAFWRSDTVNAILNREGASDNALNNTRAGDDSDSDSGWSPLVTLRLDAYLAKHVSGVIELENARLRSNISKENDNVQAGAGAVDRFAVGVDPLDERGTWGTDSNEDQFGSRDMYPAIKQAYIQADEFLSPCLSLKVGIFDEVWDLRGNGNPFFMGLRTDGAEYASIGPVTEAFGSFGQQWAYSNVVGAGGFGLFRDSAEAGGMTMTYKADEHLIVELFTLNLVETGWLHEDEFTYGGRIQYNMPDSPSVIQGFVSVISNDYDHNRMYNVGFGVDYWVERAEVFGEFIYQTGDYADEGAIFNNTLAGADGVIDQEAWAGYIGIRYNFDVQMHPYFEALGQWITGDNGDHDDTGDQNEDFVSYEDNDSLMILEDNLYGLDVDSNYWKLQAELGATHSLCCEDDLRFRLVYAYNELVDSPDMVERFDDQPSRSLEKQLGHEFDMHADWAYSDSLRFGIGAGWLWGGPFWDEDEAFGADTDTSDTGESMWMVVVDAQLRF
ncbi:MAG: hypothetical protein AAB434_04975 [Planctomycetota bacterium]